MATYCSPRIKIDEKIDKKRDGMSRSDNFWKNGLIIALSVLTLVMAGLYASSRMGGVRAEAAPDDLRQLHETLLADASSVRGHWLRTLNPLVKHVQGDLVWNSQRQQGVMRIRDLPKPDKGMVYQLWLYDTRAAADKPVSGGVLHTDAGGDELYAPIRAETPVAEPYKFVLKLQQAVNGDAGQVLLMVQP